jgi:AraC-like DNA-binding protein
VSPTSAQKPRGVLSSPSEAEGITRERFVPSAELAPFVAHFWTVRWDLRGRSSFWAETLPHPCVHLLFERGRARVAGLSTKPFRRRLWGQARVFGVKFRPAAFYPVYGAPLSRLRDRVQSLSSVFGKESRWLTRAILAEPDVQRCVELAEAFLQERLPAMPPRTAALRDLVERLAVDQTITRVEQAAALAGLDVRSLQRHFLNGVGMSPKWVIARYRLHEAVEQLAQPQPPHLADLALRLGYFDQPHFIHSFKATTGRPPGQHMRHVRRRRGTNARKGGGPAL